MKPSLLKGLWIVAIAYPTLLDLYGTETGWENYGETQGNQPRGVVRADFDGDNTLDIAYIEAEGYLYVESSKYSRTKKYHVCYRGEPTAMIQGDFDGKQGVDIITGDSNGDIFLFHNDGQGNFAETKKTKLGHSSSRIAGLGAEYKVAEQDYDLIATFADKSKAVLKNVRRYYERKLFLTNIE